MVVAIRDITFASIRTSENSLRYLDETHINILDWNRDSIRELLRHKLRTLDSRYFIDPQSRTVESWLGYKTIANGRPNPAHELLEDYLLRHTRLVPRDIIVLGNDFCRVIATHERSEITPELIRAKVAERSRGFANAQIATCANQSISDLLPAEAIDHDFENIYLQPQEYTLAEFQGHVLSCIETTGSEVFHADGVKRLTSCAEELFGQPVRLADILWQQGLLGYVDQNGSHYFSLSSSSQHVLPRLAPSALYRWNPILFDLTRRIEHAEEAPF
ncbi:hypothetical protein QOZ86_16880 [Blastococcus capsensis]|nr:hypothetical protein [Blastococcus capsensis]MDK3258181.1 hypothetical protein [Blastococcus capsensis]